MQIRPHYQAALEQQIAFDASADQDGLRGEAQIIAMEMEKQGEYMQRLNDVADALQDTILSVEGLREADPHHLMLFEACLNMAQVGTSENAENIQPGLESYLGSTISTEGVAESIQKLLAAIIRMIREMWHFLSDFFVSIFNEVGRLRLRVDYVRSLVDAIDGKNPVREQVAMGNSAYGVCTEAGVPHDARSVILSLTELLNQTQVIRQHVGPIMQSIGDGFARTLPTWPNDPAKNAAWLADLNKIASAFHPHSIAAAVGRAYPSHNPQLPAGAALAAASLPGSRSLTFISGDKIHPDKANGSEVDQAVARQADQIVLMRHRQSSNIDLSKATMETIPNNHLMQIVDLVEKILNEAETGIKSGYRARMERLGRQLEAAASKIDSNTASDITRLRKGLRYTSVFAGWVQSPYVQLLAHDLMVCRATLNFVSHHCAAYHK